MPGRDGTGPLGQGSRTGWGMGNCNSSKKDNSQSSSIGMDKPLGWSGRLWDTTLGRLFGRRRGGRKNGIS